jgi:hypothetical protein
VSHSHRFSIPICSAKRASHEVVRTFAPCAAALSSGVDPAPPANNLRAAPTRRRVSQSCRCRERTPDMPGPSGRWRTSSQSPEHLPLRSCVYQIGPPSRAEQFGCPRKHSSPTSSRRTLCRRQRVQSRHGDALPRYVPACGWFGSTWTAIASAPKRRASSSSNGLLIRLTTRSVKLSLWSSTILYTSSPSVTPAATR